jgi:hypothetical protein
MSYQLVFLFDLEDQGEVRKLQPKSSVLHCWIGKNGMLKLSVQLGPLARELRMLLYIFLSILLVLSYLVLCRSGVSYIYESVDSSHVDQ